MKILMVSGIYPPDSGGPACYVPRMAEALSSRGHRVTVVCLGERAGLESGNGFLVEKIRRSLFWPARVVWTFVRISVRAMGCDVVFVNGLAAEAALGARVLNKPTVHKVVGDSAWERAVGRGWFSGKLDQFQHARSWRMAFLKGIRSGPLFCAAAVITPSRYLAELVQSWRVPASRVLVVYNSADPHRAVELAGGQSVDGRIRGEREWTVITVCRLVPWKGVKELIEAIGKIPGTRLWVVGDGGQRKYLESEAVRLGARERVDFFGAQPRSQVFGLLKKADVFVLNSTYEGLPHVVLEAMAVGVPVVATAVGGTPEVVEDGKTGLLVESGNQVALVSALLRLRGDTALAEALTREATARMSEKWSEERMIESTEAVLEAVARKGGRK